MRNQREEPRHGDTAERIETRRDMMNTPVAENR
jgi:hypothetical protein